MACDRHEWRALFILIAIVPLASAAGCLRSTFLRDPVEPVLERPYSTEHESKPGEGSTNRSSAGKSASQLAQSVIRDTPGAALATPLTSVPTPAFSDPVPSVRLAAASSGPTAPIPPAPKVDETPSPINQPLADSDRPSIGLAFQAETGREIATHGKEIYGASADTASDRPTMGVTPPAGAANSAWPREVASPTATGHTPTATPSTPLLDAAMQRVEAVTREQRESSSVADAPLEPQGKLKPTPKPSGPKATSPANSIDSLALFPISLARTGESRESPDAVRRQSDLPPSLPRAPGGSTESPRGQELPELPAGPLGTTPAPDRRDKPGHSPTSPTSTTGSAKVDEPLGVASLQLCRKVHSFGSYEPWTGATVRAGQRVLLYCEMTGLHYEPAGSGFASRLSSRVELRTAGSGAVIWQQQLGIAKDDCTRIRHDYYVSYRLTLPEALPVGKHRLRIVQTDLATDQSASSEIDLIVVP
jgi:hypothetical protein